MARQSASESDAQLAPQSDWRSDARLALALDCQSGKRLARQSAPQWEMASVSRSVASPMADWLALQMERRMGMASARQWDCWTELALAQQLDSTLGMVSVHCLAPQKENRSAQRWAIASEILSARDLALALVPDWWGSQSAAQLGPARAVRSVPGSAQTLDQQRARDSATEKSAAPLADWWAAQSVRMRARRSAHAWLVRSWDSRSVLSWSDSQLDSASVRGSLALEWARD